MNYIYIKVNWVKYYNYSSSCWLVNYDKTNILWRKLKSNIYIFDVENNRDDFL